MSAYELGLTYNPDNAHPRTLSESDVYELVTTAGWRAKTGEGSASYATAVVMAESGGRTDAVSSNPAGGTNVGLFQIWSGNVSHPAYLKDDVYNANVARRMYLADGGTFRKKWDPRTIAKADAARKIHGPASEAVNPLDQGLTPLIALGKLASALQSADTWFRVGKGALGGVLIIAGTGAVVFVVANKASKGIPRV